MPAALVACKKSKDVFGGAQRGTTWGGEGRLGGLCSLRDQTLAAFEGLLTKQFL